MGVGRTSDAKEKLMEAVMELLFSGSYGSTTIDLICDKAGVKKGSFYHFFASKGELAAAALDAEAAEHRVVLDAIFSPVVPPLERFRRFSSHCYQEQLELQKTYGRVLGCPLCTLGSEVSTLDEKLRERVEFYMGEWRKYVESAIRDAASAGLIHAPDTTSKANMLLAYYEGVMTQARINNEIEILKNMDEGLFALLGVKKGAEKRAIAKTA